MKKSQLRNIIRESIKGLMNEQIGNDVFGQQKIQRCPYLYNGPDGKFTRYDDYFSDNPCKSLWTGEELTNWGNEGSKKGYYVTNAQANNSCGYSMGPNGNGPYGFHGWPGLGASQTTPGAHGSAQNCLIRPTDTNRCWWRTKSVSPSGPLREIWCVVGEKGLTIPGVNTPPGTGEWMWPKIIGSSKFTTCPKPLGLGHNGCGKSIKPNDPSEPGIGSNNPLPKMTNPGEEETQDSKPKMTNPGGEETQNSKRLK